MPMQVYQLSGLGKRAIQFLEKAIEQVRDGEDAIPTVCHAEAVLRVEAGELQPGDVDGVSQGQVDAWSDGAVHGHHDGVHRTTWANR